MQILVHNPRVLVLEHQPYASQMIGGGGALAGACLMYFSPDAKYGGFWLGLVLLLAAGIFYLRVAYVLQWVFDKDAGLLRQIRKRRYFGIRESTFPLNTVKEVSVLEILSKTRIQNPEEDSRSPRYELKLVFQDGQTIRMHDRKMDATAGLTSLAVEINTFLKGE